MKYRISSPGWPIAGGAVLILGDIDADTNSLVQGLIPPLTATALDSEAWEIMKKHYPAHLLGPPPQG
jgi:hypothetical protein